MSSTGIAIPDASKRIAQTIDNLRITDEELKVKNEECNALRARLQETQQELDRTTLLLRRQENLTLSKTEELLKVQHSLDIVLAELSSKRQAMEALHADVQRLKRDLENSQRHSGEVTKALQSKSVAKEVGGLKDSPSSLYVTQCFRSGCDPHTDIVRGLHEGTSIEAVRQPVSFAQLSALTEVLDMKRTLDPLEASGPSLTRLAIAVESEDSFLLIASIIKSQTSLSDVELHGVGNLAAQEIAAALAVAEHVCKIALPNLVVGDTGFQALMRVFNNREQLYLLEQRKFDNELQEAKAAKNESLVSFLLQRGPAKRPIEIRHLDVSRASLRESKSFELISGSSILSLDLSGCEALSDGHVGEILRNCTSLVSLSMANCSQLTNETVSYLNTARYVTSVALKGCHAVSKLTLLHVESLDTDLTGVSYLEGPRLQHLTSPIVHFRLVAFSCPLLESVTFQGLSFSARELAMIAESSRELSRLRFVSCRLTGADYFFRMLRHLTHLSLHACKGITDTEITCICSRLQVLDLTDSYCLTDRSVKYVADTCLGLTHLTLKRCANITDQGISALTSHSSLEYLNALGMKKVTIVALHRLIHSIPSLQRVVHEQLVSAQIQVDREDVEEVQKETIRVEQSALMQKKDSAALAYATQSGSASSPPRYTTAVDGVVKTPRPPQSMAAPSPHAAGKLSANGLLPASSSPLRGAFADSVVANPHSEANDASRAPGQMDLGAVAAL